MTYRKLNTHLIHDMLVKYIGNVKSNYVTQTVFNMWLLFQKTVPSNSYLGKLYFTFYYINSIKDFLKNYWES